MTDSLSLSSPQNVHLSETTSLITDGRDSRSESLPEAFSEGKTIHKGNTGTPTDNVIEEKKKPKV